MKTIHIKGYIPIINGVGVYRSDIPKLQGLIRELYACCLKDDGKFHHFFEPELIVRIDSVEVLNAAKDWLNSKSIEFEEYDYPFPAPGQFGEDANGIVANHLELFIAIFHAHSVAAIIMNDEDHLKYLERVIHTAFNPRFASQRDEGNALMMLAKLKLG
jgi:hypothetical protein